MLRRLRTALLTLALGAVLLVATALPAHAVSAYCSPTAVAVSGYRVNPHAVSVTGRVNAINSTLHYVRNGADTGTRIHAPVGTAETAQIASSVSATYSVRSYGDTGQVWYDSGGHTLAYCQSATITIA